MRVRCIETDKEGRVRGNIFMDDNAFSFGEISFKNGIITDVRRLAEHDLDEDEKRAFITPGFIDIHMHGCCGYDTCSASKDEFIKMAAYERKRGITSFLPATMTLKGDELIDICSRISSVMEDEKAIKGIYLEGPFISKEKCGAQNPDNAILPNDEIFEKIWQASKGKIRIVTIAPELKGAVRFIDKNKDRVVCSVGHTTASFDETVEAFKAGACHLTHLYNAMTGMDHRQPGVVGASFDSDVNVEIICDGKHVHPAVIRNTFRIFKSQRVIMISDSTQATGMPDGVYRLGDQTVYKEGRKATLKDKTLAGSVSDLFDCFTYVISQGISIEQAVMACTCNPAKAAGIFDEVGSVKTGKRADLIMIEDEGI